MEELATYAEQTTAPPQDPLFDARTMQQLQSRFFTLVHRSPYEALAALEAGEAATQDPEYHEQLVRLVADFHAEEAR
ncbi:hypothetical protein [Oceanidesulfovibrio marinus]|uniref:Uncharacterized protein n=1 Tax=Oceanidesulfovibrio marinus TaxID=370038 RepID=A0A6P1ZJZ8_9BACT|nr:hypothetical protein [Oceanidesulfovibrio marinus]TVM35640.1 hypothetical protein DQK91_02950 [Oceanidesulfovibrio marinus]